MNKQSIGANPVGMVGKLAGKVMNLIHDKLYKSIIMKIYEAEGNKKITIIDIGCGGGIAIKHLAGFFNEAQVYGIDISPDMVNLASNLNRKAISEGKVEIFVGNVEEINIKDKTVNLITIFDNINFWSNYDKAFTEMRRILKIDGKIIIVNGYPEIGTKWYDFVKFKNVDEYRKLLEDHGFSLKNHEMRGDTIILEGRLC